MTDEKMINEQAKADNLNEGRNSNSTGPILADFGPLQGTIKRLEEIPITELYRAVCYLTMEAQGVDRVASFFEFVRILTACDEKMQGVVLEIALSFAFMQSAEFEGAFHSYQLRRLQSGSSSSVSSPVNS